MIQEENLDIRTITMGISLLDCCDSDIQKACGRIYEKITRRAERLVRTECTHFASEARLLSYKETGVKRYRFVGGGEGGHCHCAELNGQEYDVDAAKPGIDYPPIHPNCTCTIVAVPSRRMFAPYEAVPIPESIKYEDWYDDYVAHTQRPPRRRK